MSTTRSRKTFEFGPGERLTGSISDPPHGRAAIGAVIVGMGIAEFRVARKLASLGIVTLQNRERNEDPEWKAEFNKPAIANFRKAIKFLPEHRGDGRYIGMGNGGGGSVAFRVALDDPHVIGLIHT